MGDKPQHTNSGRYKQSHQLPSQMCMRTQTPLSELELTPVRSQGPSQSCPNPLLWVPCPPLDQEASGQGVRHPAHSYLPRQSQLPQCKQTSNSSHCSQPFTFSSLGLILTQTHLTYKESEAKRGTWFAQCSSLRAQLDPRSAQGQSSGWRQNLRFNPCRILGGNMSFSWYGEFNPNRLRPQELRLVRERQDVKI